MHTGVSTVEFLELLPVPSFLLPAVLSGTKRPWSSGLVGPGTSLQLGRSRWQPQQCLRALSVGGQLLQLLRTGTSRGGNS